MVKEVKEKGLKLRNWIADRHSRLIISLVIATITLLLSRKLAPVVCSMVTWTAFAASTLIFSWIIILTFHPTEVKATADKEDASGTFIFIAVILAAFFSLFAIIVGLSSVSNGSAKGVNSNVLLAFASVFSSWTLVHTLFTLRYAHLYYTSNASQADDAVQALSFPNEDEPDYLDFAYFSFVVGMTFQVSDVAINSKKIRRLSLLHSFLSFIYNTVIVALSINILSGVISK